LAHLFKQRCAFRHKFAAQNSLMSFREESIQKRQNHFRTSMDLGMGMFYTAIGVILLFAKSFGNMEIPPVVAYILGGMLTIGGAFRFYRGLKVMLPKKKERTPQQRQ
jgi:hypothetical protein